MFKRAFALLAITAAVAQVKTFVPVTQQMLENPSPNDWLMFSRTYDAQRYSPLNQINKQNVGQLALANVANLQGLKMQGNGDYVTTVASGTASIGVSGAAGLGTLQDGALEASNVNISAEFSNLIVAQRAFEANSKAVTTFDTVTQETINMIH